MTLRQLEAFYWSAVLGNFSAAAVKLHMTQSALSKRVAELESVLGMRLFDRDGYRPQVTAQGRSLLEKARRMLALQTEIQEMDGAQAELVGDCRFGITELVAMTWLPELVASLRDQHPGVVLEPDVDVSMGLHEKLLAGAIDFAVMPMRSPDRSLVSEPLSKVEFAWMASPELVGERASLTPALLATHPVLVQSAGSGLTPIFDAWSHSNGLSIHRTLASNSLAAIADMVVAGLGIGFLPVAHFSPLRDRGDLCQLRTARKVPWLDYYLVHRPDETSGVARALFSAVRQTCDFVKPHRLPRGKVKAAGAAKGRATGRRVTPAV